MIKANHRNWADLVFHRYILRLMRKHFSSIQLQGEFPSVAGDLPVLLLPNHCSWWDGFFIYLLNKKLFRRPLYLMMLQEQLEKYPFFSKVGAYSIQPEKPREVRESLMYTLDILRLSSTPSPLVCLFPQGELRPAGIRPLGIKNGYEWLIKHFNGKLTLIPLAIKLEFMDQQRPEVFLRLGESLQCSRDHYPHPAEIGQMIASLLDQTNQSLIIGKKGKYCWMDLVPSMKPGTVLERKSDR